VTDRTHGENADAASGLESSDVMGILDSVDVPIVVIDRDCNVTRFNRAATAMLGLAASDVGRSLCDIPVLKEATDLVKQCHRVVADQASCRREFSNGDRWFLVQIAPHSQSDPSTRGAVLTFTNMTGFRASIGQAVYEREYTKAILNTVIDPLVVLDADLQVQTGNRAFYELFGVSREESQGVPLSSLGTSDWKTSDLWASFQAVVSGSSEFQTREIDRDFPATGHRTMRVDARRLTRDKETRLLVTFQDITERKRAEDALKDNERRFREMIDSLPAAIYTTDADGLLTHFNPACVELSGRSPQIGTDYWCVSWKLYYADGTPMPHDECPMAVALKQGRIIRGAEAIAERPDGSRIWFTPYPTPMRNAEGQIVGGINMLLDITERKEAEEELRVSEQRFRTLFESMDEGYCVVEVIFDEQNKPIDYRFLEINPAFEKQTGIRNAKGRLMRQIAPEHEQHWFEMYGRIARTGETIRFENPAVALGRYFDVCAFRVGSPELLRVGIVFNDITERKMAEEAIRQSKEALTQADKRKDEFLATLAHELRGPLAPIRNMLEVLKRADGDAQVMHEAVPTMDRQLVQMTRLIDDLLDLSRISQGRIELKREQVELNSILHHAIEANRPLAECAKHDVVVVLPEEPIYLNGDPVRLAQIFGNLLNNSCKYTPPGGKIWLSANREGSGLAVKVKDTGVGIPPSKLAGVFEMFAQLDQSLDRAQGGLGIGLTLVKRLAELHGGTVTAHSDGAGCGSEFTIHLPVVVPQTSVRPSEPAADRTAKSRRILVVDDNRDSAMSLAMLLKMTGNDTQLAHDGSEAVEKADAFRPDLILLDIGLPKMNGYDACRAIRNEPWGKNIVLVALSGWGQAEDRRKSQEAGFDLHLVKPVEYTVLSSFLTKLDAAPM
jgi:PAS domain S-box-containing protein